MAAFLAPSISGHECPKHLVHLYDCARPGLEPAPSRYDLTTGLSAKKDAAQFVCVWHALNGCKGFFHDEEDRVREGFQKLARGPYAVMVLGRAGDILEQWGCCSKKHKMWKDMKSWVQEERQDGESWAEPVAILQDSEDARQDVRVGLSCLALLVKRMPRCTWHVARFTPERPGQSSSTWRSLRQGHGQGPGLTPSQSGLTPGVPPSWYWILQRQIGAGLWLWQRFGKATNRGHRAKRQAQQPPTLQNKGKRSGTARPKADQERCHHGAENGASESNKQNKSSQSFGKATDRGHRTRQRTRQHPKRGARAKTSKQRTSLEEPKEGPMASPSKQRSAALPKHKRPQHHSMACLGLHRC